MSSETYTAARCFFGVAALYVDGSQTREAGVSWSGEVRGMSGSVCAQGLLGVHKFTSQLSSSEV